MEEHRVNDPIHLNDPVRVGGANSDSTIFFEVCTLVHLLALLLLVAHLHIFLELCSDIDRLLVFLE